MTKYIITDMENNEILDTIFDENDLVIFANDLFWDEDVDFNTLSLKDIISAIENCDYEVKIIK